VTQFESKSFSVALGLDEQGRKNYDRIFRKKPAKKPKPKAKK
jgi:hypothetical protein